MTARQTVDYSLYLVTDSTPAILGDADLVEVVRAAVNGGVTLVQFRDKTSDTGHLVDVAKKLHKVTQAAGVPLLINDRIDVALAVGAEGVHVGQDDLDLATARKLLGPKAIIGVSTNTVEEALRAAKGGADYIGIGTVYSTQTKQNIKSVIGPSGVQSILAELAVNGFSDLKTVCIGGINASNAQKTLYQAASPRKKLDGVAIVSAIMASKDPEGAASSLLKLLSQLPPSVAQTNPDPPALTNEYLATAVPKLIARVAAKKPLNHNMTNLVVQNFAANVALAMGSSPIMSNNSFEAADLAALGGSLVINMGTTTPEVREHHLRSLAAYNAAGGPVILDPVGAGATEQRRQGVRALLAGGYFDVLKGNEGEIRTASGASGVKQHGVDSGASQIGLDEKIEIVRTTATKLRNIVLMTGEKDVVSDGKRTLVVSNGHPYLGDITGSGCALGTTIAGVVAVEREDKLLAVVTALLMYEIAAERAAKRDDCRGPGTFVPTFIDELAAVKMECTNGNGSWLSGMRVENASTG